MFRLSILILALTILFSCSEENPVSSLLTPFELSDSTATATYENGIEWWKALASSSDYVSIKEFGETDAGLPLHVVVVSLHKHFSSYSDKTVWLINNGIHPGEPDGIDASMLYVRDLIQQDLFDENFRDIVLLIIPFYNVGGALNRNCCSRANQNGPSSYGFRGNAKNLDLNRDFIKADSKNAQSFAGIIQEYNVDVYIESHVSNGADYPYTMTYLLSHHDKLTPPLDKYMTDIIAPSIDKGMKELNDEAIPYVNVWSASPDSGYAAFYDSPRYSTGYLALHNTIAMLTETHMLKPFAQRVESTLRFFGLIGEFIVEHREEIEIKRNEAIGNMLDQEEFVVHWETDYEKPTPLNFKGFRAFEEVSEVTKMPQLYYDNKSSWEAEIPYFNRLKPVVQVSAPEYYLIPNAWREVIDRLEMNGVQFETLVNDTTIDCTVSMITAFETSTKPYEGHYFHYNTKVEKSKKTVQLRRNEYSLVPLNQISKRFLIESLEPEGPDSYFNWNFFDEILQQKEWFSSYVFDKEAEEMLKDESISEGFRKFLHDNPDLLYNSGAQLYHLYTKSEHFEKDKYRIYPIFRIEKK